MYGLIASMKTGTKEEENKNDNKTMEGDGLYLYQVHLWIVMVCYKISTTKNWFTSSDYLNIMCKTAKGKTW